MRKNLVCLGALVAASMLVDYPPEDLLKRFKDVAKQVKSLTFGAFNPKFNVNKMFREQLEQVRAALGPLVVPSFISATIYGSGNKYGCYYSDLKVLPDDIDAKLNGRLHISLTDTTMQNVIQSQFSSKGEVMDALVCSCFLPAFSSYEVPTFRGSPFLDGGFRYASNFTFAVQCRQVAYTITHILHPHINQVYSIIRYFIFSNNQPIIKEEPTVRISPFAGASHICPDDGTPSERKLLFQKFSGETLELSLANFKRLAEAAVPAENLDSLYKAGYEHTDKFIRSGKVREFFLDIPTTNDSSKDGNHQFGQAASM